MNNSKGQMTVEMVVLSAVLIMAVNFISNKFEELSLLQEMTLNPWNGYIAGMIENGSWGTPDQTINYHPQSQNRHASVQGELIQ